MVDDKPEKINDAIQFIRMKTNKQNVFLKFDETKYDGVVSDINLQDVKPVQQKIKESCSFSGNAQDFRQKLADFITTETEIYKELKSCIFT